MERIRELSMSAVGWDHAILNQRQYRSPRFIMPSSNSAALESMLASEDGDFSNFMDDDGELGITIAEQLLVPSDDWFDSSHGGWRSPALQLEEDDDMLGEGSATADTSGQCNLNDLDVQESPCPKRLRTTDSSLGSEHNIRDEGFASQAQPLSTPSAALHDISV